MPFKESGTDWFGRAAMFIIFGTLVALIVDVYLESPPALHSLTVSSSLAASVAGVIFLARWIARRPRTPQERTHDDS